MNFGDLDTSYKAAGKQEGLMKLSQSFYQIMGNKPEYKRLFDMHAGKIELSIDKLALFLCGWLGGPKLFREKYGPIAIPKVHSFLNVTKSEHDQWINCMEEAINTQDFTTDFKVYLLNQLKVPAKRVLEYNSK